MTSTSSPAAASRTRRPPATMATIVADELLRAGERAADLLVERDRLRDVLVGAERRLGASALALRLHLLRPRRFRLAGDAPALVDEDLLRKVAGKAVRVVEREQEAAVDRPASARAL